MRYYIKTDLRLTLGGSGFLPRLCDLQIGTILADETTSSLLSAGLMHPQIGGIVPDNSRKALIDGHRDE